MKTLICALAFLGGIEAYAGGMDSGGGYVIEDGLNPWFLQNTTDVNYCVLIDQEHFSVPLNDVKNITAEALNYWKKEFARIDHLGWYRTKDYEALNIATQNFHYVDSCDGVDLKFQFGYLDEQQKKEIENPQRTIGTAFRTDYDRVKMRGKGYIYVGADNGGPLNIEMEDIREKVWSYCPEPDWNFGGMLHKILVHELGHMFGLAHVETVGDTTIMSEGFPEDLISKESTQIYAILDVIEDFFSNGSESAEGFLNDEETIHRYLGIPLSEDRITFSWKDNEYKFSYTNGRLFGTFTQLLWANEDVEMRRIYLPKEQKVFTGIDSPPRYITMPPIRQVRAQGLYKSEDGRVSRPMTVKINPLRPGGDGLHVHGILDEKILAIVSM